MLERPHVTSRDGFTKTDFLGINKSFFVVMVSRVKRGTGSYRTAAESDLRPRSGKKAVNAPSSGRYEHR